MLRAVTYSVTQEVTNNKKLARRKKKEEFSGGTPKPTFDRHTHTRALGKWLLHVGGADGVSH